MTLIEGLAAIREVIGSAKEWQELIAGTLAVLAAAAAIFQSRFYELRKNKRRANAARATLPLVLSGICGWAIDTGRLLKDLLTPSGVSLKARLAVRPLATPTEHIAALEQMIEATDDEAVINRISRLIGNMQILNARISGLSDQHLTVIRDDIISYIVDAAVIYAQAESMFSYARRVARTVPATVGWDRPTVALYTMKIYSGSTIQAHEAVQRRSELMAHIEPDSDF